MKNQKIGYYHVQNVNKKQNSQLISQENKGLGGARNTGIKNATYEFITFLDADDLWYPEKLLKVARIFEKEPHIDLVCHDEDVMRNGEKVRKNIYGPYCKYEDWKYRLFLEGTDNNEGLKPGFRHAGMGA